MADPDPNQPQVVDPERVVDLTRLLQIRGPLGVLNVLDTIVPVVNMGDVVPRTVTVLQPAFRTTDIFSNGIQTNQGAGTALASTGALAEGTYDFRVELVATTTIVDQRVAIEWRNAANSANVAIWERLIGMFSTTGGPSSHTTKFALEIADNERIRAVQVLAGAVAASLIGTIFARRRD